MVDDTVSPQQAQRIYDRLGGRYDWAERFEGRAKTLAMDGLALCPGERVVDVGMGTGRQLALLREAVGPKGLAVGVDISPVMAQLAQQRKPGPVCRGDARRLPFATGSVAALFTSYLLDLLPAADLLPVLEEFHRVLRPGGRLALVTLTEGVTVPSRAVVGLWKAVFRLNPTLAGGCRPLQSEELVQRAGFRDIDRRVVVQLGVPSEVILAVA